MSAGRVCRFFLTIGILLALAASASAGPIRDWEPVVVEGAQLRPLLGVPVNTFEVLAGRDGKLNPIPFQVDPATTEAAAASVPRCSPTDEKGAPLRAADELVMLLSDFGDAANSATPLPAGALEIAIKDPLGGPDRYAYVDAAKNPRRSTLSYVQFDPSTERVETDFYRFGLSNGWPSDFTYQNQRFEHRPSLIDRLNVSMSSRVFGVFPYAMTEHDLRISQPVVRCGPVRVTLRYHYAVTLIAGIRSPSVVVPIAFYRQYITSPLAVHFPWLPRLFFGGTRIRINVDYGVPRHASLLWDGDRAGLVLNEAPLAGRQSAAMDPGPSVDWVALRQDGHLLAQAFPTSRDLDLIQHNLTYRGPIDGAGAARGTTKMVKIGYEISRLEELSAGKHVFDACFAVLDESSDPQTFFHELRAAPVVMVRPLPVRAAPRRVDDQPKNGAAGLSSLTESAR
ncbi:MAG TPA: hypothetical protein VN742_11465 [Candidatus Binataceae bacterium]|nr:hypothetical protein [Candidatus Binataceae bacterium]